MITSIFSRLSSEGRKVLFDVANLKFCPVAIDKEDAVIFKSTIFDYVNCHESLRNTRERVYSSKF